VHGVILWNGEAIKLVGFGECRKEMELVFVVNS